MISVIIITLGQRTPAVGMVVSRPLHHTVLAWPGPQLRGPKCLSWESVLQAGCPFLTNSGPYPLDKQKPKCSKWKHRPFLSPPWPVPTTCFQTSWTEATRNIGAIIQMFYICCAKLKSRTSFFGQNACVKRDFPTLNLMSQHMLSLSLYLLSNIEAQQANCIQALSYIH